MCKSAYTVHNDQVEVNQIVVVPFRRIMLVFSHGTLLVCTLVSQEKVKCERGQFR